MARSLIRTIDRWRFERPLAVALGASAAFAMWAMPAPLYAALPLVGLLVQPLGAAIVAIVLALAGWLAMRRRGPVRARRAPGIHVRVARVKPAPKPEAEPVVRLRRADRHPDAPARAPIRAHRDLGSPFMEVDTAPPPPTVIDLPPPPPIDVTAITVAPSAPEPAPVAEAPAVRAEAPIAEPAPARPVRGRSRADLGAMIDRLADGLASRAADPAARRPSPALVDALEELNRIAARRR